MRPYEIVLDTNVLVSAARSRRGASYALLQTMTKHKWRMNISSALLLEYESKLKIEAKRQGWPPIIVDEFLDLIAAASHHRQIYFLLRPFLRDPGDDFIIELAVASRAQFIVTYNTRDFTQAVEYGVRVVKPQDFLRILENAI